MPIPTPHPAMPFTFSMIAVIACAAIAVVPSVDTLDWIASFPNWNIPFSMPAGTLSHSTFRIMPASGRTAI